MKLIKHIGLCSAVLIMLTILTGSILPLIISTDLLPMPVILIIVGIILTSLVCIFIYFVEKQYNKNIKKKIHKLKIGQ